MRWIGILRATALAASVAAMAGCVVPLVRRPLVKEYQPLAEQPVPIRPVQLTARFLGTSTIVLRDDRTTIMIDGFFSRPSKRRLLWLPVRPNKGRIDRALRAANVNSASAIFLAQSHHDHAMDAPYVAQMTGATIVGSSSTENIALGVGFRKSRIERIADRSTCRFGAFTVTIFQTPHSSPMPFPGEIREPLHRTAWVEDYKEGGNFTFHVAHPFGNVLIVPSRGVRKGWTLPMTADTVFLGVGGIVWSADQLRPLWHQYVVGSKARTVYPIHWDNFFKAPDLTPPPGIPKGLKRKLRYLRQLEDREGMVQVPRYATEIPVGKGRHSLHGPPAEAGSDGCFPRLSDAAVQR